MNRTLLALIAMAAAHGFLNAQHLRRVPALPEQKHDGPSIAPAVRPTVNAKGTAFFNEPFDNDLNGWTVVSGIGTLDWAWTNSGPGPTTSTYPVPALNTSTPSGWAIIDDDYLGTPGQQAESSLVSPVIDLSSAPANLKVEFDQYFQEFSDPDVETWVGVSTDGGTNWDEVLINEGVGRDGRPNPEQMDVDISAWVAANPSNVQLRFRYLATWDYGWQLDNIAIRELPNNDMALVSFAKTDFDFDLTGVANMDYSIYPLSQIRPMQMSGLLKNKGYLAQTGVSITTTVSEPGGANEVLNGGGLTFAPGETVSVPVTGYTPPSTVGSYSLDNVVTQNETDEVPSNNTSTDQFEVSTTTWAHDDGAVQSFILQGPDFAGDQFGVGNRFDLVADAQLVGVQVAIHDTTEAGTLIAGEIYDADDILLDQTTDHEILSSELNSVGGSTFITLNFDAPVDLFAGNAYLVMAHYFGGPEVVGFATSGTSAAQVSIVHYPDDPQGNFFYYVTRTPMVRAILAGPIGIDEANGLLARAPLVWPNPANEQTRLSFELLEAVTVRYELYAVTGELVQAADLGRLGAGEQQHLINVGDLSQGLYTWTLDLEGRRFNGRLAVQR
ncbi:MAG TPA: hypothetical protein PKE21_02345 [Flavobacteriales bacterium]|nr:hypothetical protein [Flavobacteriales bacterium]HMR26295.1 hypothetical protein [Flavobacteriales bacterium]